MRLSSKYLRRNTESTDTKECSIYWINHLNEIFMSSTRFIKWNIDNRILWIIGTSSDLSCWDIMTSNTTSSHGYLCDLPEIRELGSCEDLMSRYIAIHTIEPHILRNHSLEFCHKRNKYIIFVRYKLSFFPHLCEFWIGCHYHRVDLEFIGPVHRVFKYLFHRTTIKFWSGSYKSWHHMCHDFESCILEHLSCLNWFQISMSSFIEFINMIVCRLIPNLNTSHSIAPEPDNLLRSDPIRTSFYRHTNHTTFCSFISFFCFLNVSRWNPICMCSNRSGDKWTPIISNIYWIWIIPKGCMSIVDLLNKIFLIYYRIYAPCSSNNTDIAFWNCISCHSEWLKTILNLSEWIKFIHLSTLNSWFIRNITLRKSFVRRTIDTFSRTSPKLGKKWYYWNSWKRTHCSLSQYLSHTKFVDYQSLINEFFISLDHHNMWWSFWNAIFRKNLIFEFMKSFLRRNILIFGKWK